MADLVLAERRFDAGDILEAAKLGLPKAQGWLARQYINGSDGVSKDPDQSFFWAGPRRAGIIWASIILRRGSYGPILSRMVLSRWCADSQGCTRGLEVVRAGRNFA